MLICVDKKHRLLGAGFVLSCMLMLRMQFELIEAVGYEKEGIPGLMDSNPFRRGQVVYSIFTLILIVLSVYSRQTLKTVYLAACISIFFIAFILSTIIMAL